MVNVKRKRKIIFREFANNPDILSYSLKDLQKEIKRRETQFEQELLEDETKRK